MASVNSTSVCAAYSLAAFTSSALMLPELRGGDVTAILAELSEALQREARIPDLLPFYHAALNREYLCSTSMNYGFAFPHARLHGLKTLSFALGRSSKPILWGGQSRACGTPVRLIFLSAVPATDATSYLAFVAALSRLSREPHQLAALLAAPDAEGMLSVLQQIKLRPPQSRPPVEK